MVNVLRTIKAFDFMISSEFQVRGRKRPGQLRANARGIRDQSGSSLGWLNSEVCFLLGRRLRETRQFRSTGSDGCQRGTRSRARCARAQPEGRTFVVGEKLAGCLWLATDGAAVRT